VPKLPLPRTFTRRYRSMVREHELAAIHARDVGRCHVPDEDARDDRKRRCGGHFGRVRARANLSGMSRNDRREVGSGRRVRCADGL
jgi:hypothetical protein